MKAFRHAGIVVTDMERALHFYQDLLGLVMVRRAREKGDYIDQMSALSGVDVETCKLAADDGVLVELLCYASHPRKKMGTTDIPTIGASHVAFTVEDLDATYEQLLREGVTFNCPPQCPPDGYAKVTFCRDPDGTLIELVEVRDKTKQ